MITEAVAARAKDAVHSAMQGKWPRPSTEIQDGGEFLLMSIYIGSDSPSADTEAKAVILAAMKPILPDGGWILNVDRSGRLTAIIP